MISFTNRNYIHLYRSLIYYNKPTYNIIDNNNKFITIPFLNNRRLEYRWIILAILSCIAIMAMYAETMLIPAIPNFIK